MLRRVLFLSCAWCALAATSTQAAFMNHTSTITGTQEDWIAAFSIPQFDPALGTLHTVFFQMTTSGNLSFTLQNNTASTLNFPASYVYMIDVTLGGDAVPRMTQLDGGGGMRVPWYETLGANETKTFGPHITALYSNPARQTYDAPEPELALFTGSGLVDLAAHVYPYRGLVIDTDPTKLTRLGLDIETTIRMDVYYTYTPHLPEPSSLALVGMGVVGLLGATVRRRRRRLSA